MTDILTCQLKTNLNFSQVLLELRADIPQYLLLLEHAGKTEFRITEVLVSQYYQYLTTVIV